MPLNRLLRLNNFPSPSLSLQEMKQFTSIIRLLTIASLFVMAMSCGNKSSNNHDQTTKEVTYNRSIFFGEIIYHSTIETADSNVAVAFKTLSPTLVHIFVDSNNFRLIETGGLSHGNVIIFKDAKEVWQLDTTKKIAHLGEYSDFADPSSALKNTMPDHYAPTVVATNDSAVIAGHTCDKFRITRSGFIPQADTASIWASRDIKFPSSRFDIQTEINRVAVPAPLYIGYEEGAILKFEVRSKTNIRTMEVISLKENSFPQDIFVIPSDYQKK